MTLANRITLFRLMLIPVFIVLAMSYTREQQWARHAALATFLIAAISDGIDGFVARAYNQKTKLGAVLDPLADKLLLNLAFVFLAVNKEFATPVPYWFPVLILGRDAIIVMGSYLINEYFGPLRVRPRLSGKLTTVLQMASVCAVLLEVHFAYPLLLVTLAVSVVSFFDYVYQGVKQVGSEDMG
ncbi:MAG TPA: CDP-alcohol phosphatidyltransferase family protein [Candidatus Hydrogenedentes bacterium]|nr:CDP-alcohol phosphatidyltransferase family protein [Candidatus Hydrogenedentota bacterium]